MALKIYYSTKPDVQIENYKIAVVNKFIYLGSIVKMDNEMKQKKNWQTNEILGYYKIWRAIYLENLWRYFYIKPS